MEKLTTFFITIFSLMLFGCSFFSKQGEEVVYETGNPNVDEVLKLEPNANIFQYNDVVYQTNIDWVDELFLTKNELVGEIKKVSETEEAFENYTANKLPVGAKIYSTKERNDILIVEYDEIVLKYLAIVEG